MTTLSELMQHCTAGPGFADAEVGDDWMQGRSVFGGLQAAIAVRAMRSVVADLPLRSLQMTFLAPVAQHVQARAQLLRTGKNVTHVESRLIRGEEPLAVAVGIFGAARNSIVRRDLPPVQPLPAKARLAYIPGTTPAFMQQFDICLLEGALPFSGNRVERVIYELGLHDSGPASEAHLLAIADFVPPVALSWMPTAVPGSSLNWMLEILDDDFTTEPLSGWRIEAEMVAARDGYTSQSTTIHAPSGKAIALSRQSMVVFG